MVTVIQLWLLPMFVGLFVSKIVGKNVPHHTNPCDGVHFVRAIWFLRSLRCTAQVRYEVCAKYTRFYRL